MVLPPCFHFLRPHFHPPAVCREAPYRELNPISIFHFSLAVERMSNPVSQFRFNELHFSSGQKYRLKDMTLLSFPIQALALCVLLLLPASPLQTQRGRTSLRGQMGHHPSLFSVPLLTSTVDEGRPTVLFHKVGNLGSTLQVMLHFLWFAQVCRS